jgi:hypothetical protein
LGHLYYIQLGLDSTVPTRPGIPVVTTPAVNVGPFHNVQPYLYWASCEPAGGLSPCLATQNGVPVPVVNYGWSFSFGNGFQGTDLITNDLYVTAYYPRTSAQAADTTPPVTTDSVSGPQGSNGWFVGPTVVDLSAIDDLSGVYRTEFSLNNGANWTTGTSIPLSASGVYTILYRSIDRVGNVEPSKNVTVDIDSVPPVTTETSHIHSIRGVPISLEIRLTAFDNLSGVAATEYSLDHGLNWRVGNDLFLCGGHRIVEFRSIDVAGNIETVKTASFSTPACAGP